MDCDRRLSSIAPCGTDERGRTCHCWRGNDPTRQHPVLYGLFGQLSAGARVCSFACLPMQSGFSLLNVIEVRTPGRTWISKAPYYCSSFRQCPREPSACATVGPAVCAGKPYHDLLGHAAEMPTDLVIIGVSGRNAFDLV